MQGRNGAITLEWESRGPLDGETILLVMGLGAQLIAWRDGFCDQLVAHGYRVIRFDNRDAGLSSATEGEPPSIKDLAAVAAGSRVPRRARLGVLGASAHYTLSDMAGDAIAVLDAAGVTTAHVVGASLGGMIAQTMAIEHPDRVASLTSIMSRPGDPRSGLPSLRVLRKIMQPTPTEQNAAVTYELERAVLTSGPLLDVEVMRRFLDEARDRSPDRSRMAFQLAAILASGDRTKALRKLDAATLVIHGRIDELVRLSGGVATARAVPGSRLVVHDQMGHYIPPALWTQLTDSIADHARSAGDRENEAPVITANDLHLG